MKKNKPFLFLLTSVVIAGIVAFLTFEPKKFAMTLNEEAVYTVVQTPDSCVLRVLNGADAKEYWISGLSTKDVRNTVNMPAQINGSIIYVDQRPQDKRSSMGMTDDCASNPNGDSQIVIKIDEIKPIYSQAK